MLKGNDLGHDSIGRLVLKLAIPSMMGQLINVLYSIVDRIYIGNINVVGATALAGVGVCGPIVTLITSFATLVGLGGGPLLAMRMGERNQKGAEQILANCFAMLVALSAVLTGAVLLLREPLLMTFGASARTFVYADQYLSIYACGTIFAVLALGLNQFIICQGFSTVGMLTVVIGAVMNIVLDPILIFGFDMGVPGAAIATVVSQAASCAFVVGFLLSKKVPVRITFTGYSRRVMQRVLTFGFSPFIIIATDSLVIIALNSVLQRYGGASQGDTLITCATIVQSYMQLITMPMAGITGGTQPILSCNYGSKQVARIRQGERTILKMCVLFTGVMFVLSQTVARYFVYIFTQDPTLVGLSVWGIRVFTLGIIPLAFQYTFVDGFTALGIARVAVTLSLLRKTTLFVLTLVLPAAFGATGAFFAEPAADVLGGIVSTAVFLHLFGRLMREREQMPDDQPLYG